MNRAVDAARDVDLSFTAPPSKSFTHRALIAAALADGASTIRNPLDAADTRLTRDALAALGVGITEDHDRIGVRGCNGRFPAGRDVTLDLKNSGTSLRLLATPALLCGHPVTLTGSARMQERPVGPLADALSLAGARVTYLKKPGFPPLRVEGALHGGTIPVDARVSSQFVSSLLIAAPYAMRETKIVLTRQPASRSYLDVTVRVMEEFGAAVSRDGYRTFAVRPGQGYRGREYAVEGDYSSASYFFALAAACRGTVTVGNLNPASVQGDRQFVDALVRMGCTASSSERSVSVTRAGRLHGITLDMSSSPDTVQTLAVVAALADSPTTITGTGHLKFKESDRISSTAGLLRQLGGRVSVGDDQIVIDPAPLHGGTIDPADDHRTAMSFAVLGCAIGGITITDAESVAKSFPGFWDALDGAGL